MFSQLIRSRGVLQRTENRRHCRPSDTIQVTISALVVCWWTLIELALDFTSTDDDKALATTIGFQLLLVVCGLAVVLDSRIARAVFCFLCAMSVLAIGPALAVQLTGSPAQHVIAFMDCATRLLFLACTLLFPTFNRNPPERHPDHALATAVMARSATNAHNTSRHLY